MKSIFYKTLLITLLGFLCIVNTYACRYTVREIGFSDIGSQPYIIYVFTKSDMPEEVISTIKKLSFAVLYDSNVELKLVNIDLEKDSMVLYYIEKYKFQTFPSALFVSPQGESVICSFDYPGRSFDESLYLLLEDLVSSATRNSIIDQLLKSYCVVLVIEGKNAARNKEALLEAREAIREISGSLDQLPKVVHAPPSLLVIPQEKINDEKILLLSLGLIEEEIIEPSVTILYGRGRIMGPVLQGEQITSRRIFNLLTIVGADCECGLDNAWMLGRMIPLRWEPSVQSEIIHLLDFDVENPLVKAEMSQILSIKLVTGNPINPVENNLLGYTEGKFEIERSAEGVSKISASDIQKSFSQSSSLKNSFAFKTIMMGLGGILLLVLAIGAFLFIRYKQKKVNH